MEKKNLTIVKNSSRMQSKLILQRLETAETELRIALNNLDRSTISDEIESKIIEVYDIIFDLYMITLPEDLDGK